MAAGSTPQHTPWPPPLPHPLSPRSTWQWGHMPATAKSSLNYDSTWQWHNRAPGVESSLFILFIITSSCTHSSGSNRSSSSSSIWQNELKDGWVFYSQVPLREELLKAFPYNYFLILFIIKTFFIWKNQKTKREQKIIFNLFPIVWLQHTQSKTYFFLICYNIRLENNLQHMG